jgi:hypothetical protein
MSVTIEYHEGAVTYLSDAGLAKLAAEDAAKAQSARRNEIACGALAAAVTIFAVMELIKQAGGLQ